MTDYEEIEGKLRDGLYTLAPDTFEEIMVQEPIRLETEEELFGEDTNVKKIPRRRLSPFLLSVFIIISLFLFYCFLFILSCFSQKRTSQ